MGNSQTSVIKAYGWSEKDAISSLEAKLRFKYSESLHYDSQHNKHYAMVRGKSSYVHVIKSKKGICRADLYLETYN